MEIAGRCIPKHLHLIVKSRSQKHLEQAVEVPSLQLVVGDIG